MSTSPFSLLPFLSGWQYRTYEISAICPRGGRSKETTINSFGWLSNILVQTTDCFGTFKITPMHLQQTPPATLYPEFMKTLGLVTESPGGFLVRYYRPDAASSWGVYIMMIQAGVDAAPFSAPTKVEVSLPDLSTQPNAYVAGVATTIELTDMTAFMKSLADLPVNKNADLANAIRSLVKTLEAKK